MDVVGLVGGGVVCEYLVLVEFDRNILLNMVKKGVIAMKFV